jgi:hypothetical protein
LNAGSTMPFVAWWFPPSARAEAVAVMIKIDDDVYIERLAP